MRRVVVFVSLLSMLGLVGASVGLRGSVPGAAEDSTADASEQPTVAEASAGDAKPAEPKAELPPVVAAQDSAQASEADVKSEPPPPPKPLHVVALGWEVLAPGVLANNGMTPGEGSMFSAAGMEVEFTSVATAEAVEVRLGRGGDTKDGADVALMPLPVFVASYERLQALTPQVFFVVAWSRGRDALVGKTRLSSLPARGELSLAGQPGTSETLVGLFALEQAGVVPSRVRVVDDPSATRRAKLRTVLRRKSRQIDARDLVLSTADATHLVPIVAVAPRGVVSRRRADLVSWSTVWLSGAQTLHGDPAAAARTLASAAGAPEAVDLIDALGWMEFTDLGGSAKAAGLSGRSAVHLDSLFHHTWDLWREVGLLTTPPPVHVPLTATVIADLAHRAPAAGATQPVVSRTRNRRGKPAVLFSRAVPGRRLDAASEAKLVADVGFLAGVFSRSTVEVWVPRSPEASRRITTQVAERFGLDPERIVARTDRDRKAKTAAVITVSAAR